MHNCGCPLEESLPHLIGIWPLALTPTRGLELPLIEYEFPEPLEIVFRDRDDKINHGVVDLDLLGA